MRHQGEFFDVGSNTTAERARGGQRRHDEVFQEEMDVSWHG